MNNPLISRRHFLRAVPIVAAGTFLAGCAVETEHGQRGMPPEPVFVDVDLPPARPPTSALGQENDAQLSTFLSLSTLLTGVDGLDPRLGQIYLQSIQNNSESGAALNALFEQALGDSSALPATLEELENRGIFAAETTRKAADKITELWYTGVYQNEQGTDVVATYVDALAWKTLTFTKPMSICGSYRFWTEPPEGVID
jgi:hypothetical protein